VQQVLQVVITLGRHNSAQNTDCSSMRYGAKTTVLAAQLETLLDVAADSAALAGCPKRTCKDQQQLCAG
jgi:hypothetical protein